MRLALLVMILAGVALGVSASGCSQPYSCDLRQLGEPTCKEYVGENPFDDGWVAMAMSECHSQAYHGGPPGIWSHGECSREGMLGGCFFPLNEGGKTVDTITWYYPTSNYPYPLETSADVMMMCSAQFRSP